MNKFLLSLLIVISVFAGGCASLMVSVNDRDESAKEIKIAAGSEVNILPPTLKEGLEKEIASAGFTNDSFKETLRKEVIKELTSRGIKPVSVETAESNYIQLHVTRLERGIGFFRWFSFFGLGDSFLTVNVTMVLPEGKREIVAEKNGQIHGSSQMGDQTNDNIEYVATAVSSKITK